MILSYLPLERKLDIIYWMMKNLQSHTSLIQSQIHQLVINFHHSLRWICGSYLSMGKSLSQIKVWLKELNCHQTTRGKSKINISLFRRKSYQRTDIEDIRSTFDQVRPLVSHLEFCIPNKPPTPNNIDEILSGLQRLFWKEALFFNMTKTNIYPFFRYHHNQIPPLSKKSPPFTHCSWY